MTQSCVPPTPQKQQSVTAYLVKQRHAPTNDFGLVTSEKANDACFWKLVYEERQKPFTIYLSPDRTFLTDNLYDLRVDPLIAEQERNNAVLAELAAGDPPTMGSANAPVTLVEFSDFECPYCQRLKAILEQEVLPKESGKVKVVFRNFPLSIHPWSKRAAAMAACSALQDTDDFWKVHDFLFDSQRSLTSDNLEQKVKDFAATGTNLDKAQFQKCLDKDMALGILSRDMDLGQRNGVRATPTAFINGVRYEGIQSAAQLTDIIDRAAAGIAFQQSAAAKPELGVKR
jgi:protein-disulfide isomerase